MHKKLSSLLMAATMAATAVTPAFASEIETTTGDWEHTDMTAAANGSPIAICLDWN